MIGVKIYKESFWFCSNLNKEILEGIVNKQDCFDFGGDWMNRDYNFDNIFNGVSLLFMIANGTGWLRLL